MKVDLEGLADWRRGACLPACGHSPSGFEVVAIARLEWTRARTRYRLQCSGCGRWGRKFVPHRFLADYSEIIDEEGQ